MKLEDTTTILDAKALSAIRQQPDARAACFIVLTGSQAGRLHKLEGQSITIGRAIEALIRIEDEGVSRRHAVITREQEGISITDLGSTNGTFCNGERVDTRTLQDGDKIQIGTTTILKFSYQDSMEEEFQRRQYESATRDALTGCYNKKFFLERLPNEYAHAVRHNKPLALAMFDIDFFKKINDTYGHQAGDYVLQLVAKTVQDAIRTEDILSRYGGEEFALIMRETPIEPAFIVCERIRRKVEAVRFDYESQEIRATISMGLSVCLDRKPASPDDLIKDADMYLYRAKQGGRNRTECALLE